MTTRTIRINVTAASTAPAWFTDPSFEARTWLAIAGPLTSIGNGGTLDAVKPPPAIIAAMASSGGTTDYVTHSTITRDWNGACVDQQRKEYLMVANGGHGSWAGNDAYALKLNRDNPKWVRLNDPTSTLWPVGNGDQIYVDQPALWPDGRSRAMHTAGWQVYHNGKVWFPLQGSASGPGETNFCTVSFNRALFPDAIPVDQGGSGPVAYAGSPNPWTTNYGTVVPFTNTQPYKFGHSMLDTMTGDIWWTATVPNIREYFRIRTSPSYDPDIFYNQDSNGVRIDWSNYPTAFSVCASELRLLIVGMYGQNIVYVKRLDDDAQGFLPVTLPNDPPGQEFDWDLYGRWTYDPYLLIRPGVNKLPNQSSANYHAASKSILVHNAFQRGGAVRRLTIPTTNGVYNPAGSWAWSTVSTSTPAGMQGIASDIPQYNRCQMINDMGNGQSALVYCESTTGSTYVYKVPN